MSRHTCVLRAASGGTGGWKRRWRSGGTAPTGCLHGRIRRQALWGWIGRPRCSDTCLRHRSSAYVTVSLSRARARALSLSLSLSVLMDNTRISACTRIYFQCSFIVLDNFIVEPSSALRTQPFAPPVTVHLLGNTVQKESPSCLVIPFWGVCMTRDV